MRDSGKQLRDVAVSMDMKSAKREKFNELVDALSADLYRYAYWLSRQQAVAEDLVQETFLRAWNALDSLRDSRTAKSWLFTILRRENARRFERKQFDLADDYDLATVRGPVTYDTSTEAFALRRALDRLSEDYREPLVMQVIGGFSCEEIAQTMGISRSAVMTRLFRARKNLKDMLEDDNRNYPTEVKS